MFLCRLAARLPLLACAVGLLYLCSKFHGQGECAVPIFVSSVIGLFAVVAALAFARRRGFGMEKVFLILIARSPSAHKSRNFGIIRA